MKAEKLQKLVIFLANIGYTHYWLHYNYPEKEPWLMAIQVLDTKILRSLRIGDLFSYGFEWDEEKKLFIIERVFE